MDDDVIRGMTIVNNGSITYPPPKIEVSASVKKEDKKINSGTGKDIKKEAIYRLV